MDKTASIVIAIVLALIAYLGLVQPVTLVRFMNGLQTLWAKLFNSDTLTYEQSSQFEQARGDPEVYIRGHYSQITIMRVIGLLSILVAAGLLCMAFT